MATQFRPLGRVGSVAAFVSMIVIFLTVSVSSVRSFSQDSVEGQAAESPSPSASALATGPVASATTPVPAGRGYARQVVALGFDAATAEFMAQTLSTVEVVDAHTYAVHHAFPNGATGDVTYHLIDGGGMSPDDPPEVSGELVGDEYSYTLRYAIDASDLPLDMQLSLVDGLPTATLTASKLTAGAAQLLGLAPVQPVQRILTADSPSTVGVVVDGVISQGQSKAIGGWLKGAGLTKTEKSYKAFKAGKKVWEALEANEILADALAKLKALRKCAENPTNPLTRKAYIESPQEKQSILDDLTQIENDIRSSTVALFGMLLTDTGSSAIKAAPWLKFITAPANNYVKSTLLNLVKDYVRQAEQRVVACHRSYKISGTIPSKPGGISVSGKACSLEKPFEARTQGDLIGTFQFSPNEEAAGTWVYRGRVYNVPFSADGSGGYTVDLIEDLSAGTLNLNGSLTIHIPEFGDKSGGGPATLTLTEVPLCAG